MFTFWSGTQTVKSTRATLLALLAGAGLIAGSPAVFAESADELDVLRVDVPLNQQAYGRGALEISSLISENTYIDVQDFNLRAVEIEAFSPGNGEVRLKVGRYVTPPVPLPDTQQPGLLRIEAPHKTNQDWRLLLDDQINVNSLTAVLEPRNNNQSYYESRYEPRGYTFGNDPYFSSSWNQQTYRDSWPYSWLRSDFDFNRQASHWLWLNDSRARFQSNPSFGFGHRHSRDCYDQFGRHLSFTGQSRISSLRGLPNNRLTTPRIISNRRFLHERATRDQRVQQQRAEQALRAQQEQLRIQQQTQQRQQRARQTQRTQIQIQRQRQQQEAQRRLRSDQESRRQQIQRQSNNAKRERAGASSRERAAQRREAFRRSNRISNE